MLENLGIKSTYLFYVPSVGEDFALLVGQLVGHQRDFACTIRHCRGRRSWLGARAITLRFCRQEAPPDQANRGTGFTNPRPDQSAEARC